MGKMQAYRFLIEVLQAEFVEVDYHPMIIIRSPSLSVNHTIHWRIQVQTVIDFGRMLFMS
jgi:hypothetical protein